MRIKIITIAILVLASASAAMMVGFGAAANDSIDWITREPTIVSEQDYGTQQPVLTIRNCVDTKVMVNSSTPADFCMTPTAMGMMSQLYTNWGYVQPTGWPYAHQIDYRRGGNPIVEPVPNQASGIYFSASGIGNWIYLGLVFQISNHLSLQGLPPNHYFNVTDGMADLVFKHPNGESVKFRYSNEMFRFSSNGRYMLAKTSQGYTRIGVMDTSLTYFKGSTDPGSETWAINDRGSVAFSGAVDPYDTAKGRAVFTDINSCNASQPQTPDSPSPDYAACRQRDVYQNLRTMFPDIKNIYKAQFANDRTLTLVIGRQVVGGPLRFTAVSLTADGQMRSLKSYVALGDSFASGEGASNYRPGTDTERNRCHQSTNSYPYLLGVRQASYASVACSGAKVQNISPSNGRGSQIYGEVSSGDSTKALDEHLPGYLAQADFVDKDNPDAVTVSIGGNDVGFANIIKRCVNPFESHAGNVASGFTCYSSYEDRKELTDLIDRQLPKLRDLYGRLKDNKLDGRRVYVIGYPQIVKPGGACDLNVRLNADETKFAYDLTTYLNKVIRTAAEQAGVVYVDVSQAFDGHRLCEPYANKPAVNGISLTRTPVSRWNMSESFHPTAYGHGLLERVIAEQTDDLTKPMPKPFVQTATISADPADALYVGRLKEQRALNRVEVVGDMLPEVLTIGRPSTLAIPAGTGNLQPGGTYRLLLNGVQIGTAMAGSDGSLNASVTLPVSAAAGFQTVHLVGKTVYGAATDLQQTVYIGDDGDIDGDSVPDGSDDCGLVVNSGKDADGDGLDDACDPQIVTAPSGEGGGVDESGIVWRENAIMPMSVQTVGGP